MSTHNIHLKYRTPKRYPTIFSIMPPVVALIATFRGSNYHCLEQIVRVPKGFEPSRFDCTWLEHFWSTEISSTLRVNHSAMSGGKWDSLEMSFRSINITKTLYSNILKFSPPKN